MKDKFNYTARETIHYSCPCCAAVWQTNKLEYCPNCEVRILYSAGEEVYVEWSDEELKNNRYPIALYVTDEHLGQEIPVKRTTRPTVSEEEISDLIHDAMLRNYNSKQLAKKIMELLNR